MDTIELLITLEGNRVEKLVVPRTTKLSEVLVLLKKEKGAHNDAMLFEEDSGNEERDHEANLDEEVHVHGRRKLICHRTQKVHVKVMYNGMVEKLFLPGKTLKGIEKWAVRKIGLDPDREWCLRKDSVTGDILDEKLHIVSLVVYPNYEITLYLTEHKKIQGDS